MWLKRLKITWNKKNKIKHYIWKDIITFYATKKKKNTNAIYNLIHTHTYISSLLTYIMRGLLLNYLLTMLTLTSILKFNNK